MSPRFLVPQSGGHAAHKPASPLRLHFLSAGIPYPSCPKCGGEARKRGPSRTVVPVQQFECRNCRIVFKDPTAAQGQGASA